MINLYRRTRKNEPNKTWKLAYINGKCKPNAAGRDSDSGTAAERRR